MIAGFILAFIIFMLEIQIMDLKQAVNDLENKMKGDNND